MHTQWKHKIIGEGTHTRFGAGSRPRHLQPTTTIVRRSGTELAAKKTANSKDRSKLMRFLYASCILLISLTPVSAVSSTLLAVRLPRIPPASGGCPIRRGAAPSGLRRPSAYAAAPAPTLLASSSSPSSSSLTSPRARLVRATGGVTSCLHIV